MRGTFEFIPLLHPVASGSHNKSYIEINSNKDFFKYSFLLKTFTDQNSLPTSIIYIQHPNVCIQLHDSGATTISIASVYHFMCTPTCSLTRFYSIRSVESYFLQTQTMNISARVYMNTAWHMIISSIAVFKMQTEGKRN